MEENRASNRLALAARWRLGADGRLCAGDGTLATRRFFCHGHSDGFAVDERGSDGPRLFVTAIKTLPVLNPKA